jgi:hypothetical protein
LNQSWQEGSVTPRCAFPGNRQFAFTVFDDTDDSTTENVGPVYKLLADLGLRTTKSVWPLACLPAAPHAGSTLQDQQHLSFVRGLRDNGFEIALHGMRNTDTDRDGIRRGLDNFQRLIGYLPRSHSNHASNRDNLYWGAARLAGGWRRGAYHLATRFQNSNRFCGHVEDSKYFWGDCCREHITYVRNFVFDEINLDRIGAAVPYHDPGKPFVNYWFSSCEGNNQARFCWLLSERNQDRLEAEGGVCIVYTHFARGFVEHGQLNPRFASLMRRLAQKNGWFVPVSTLLDHLRNHSPSPGIAPSHLANLETRWLLAKFRLGHT